MAGLTWLHLSDWHQRGPDFDRQVVRDALLADLRDRATLDPALADVDAVFFSGDAAWAGKAEEFAAARQVLFDPVLKVLKDGGLPPKKLFFVPGNHDLGRGHVAEMLPPALQKPLTTDAEVQHWLTDDKRRNRVLEPFEDYAAFVTGFTGQKTPAYASTWFGFINQKTVGILCLNSAWMCGRNQDTAGEVNDFGFLTVGEPQIHDALRSIEAADVRIALIHHPFPWLAEFDRNPLEDRLKRTCHFIVHGHEHQPKFSLERALSGECAVIPAGACYNRRIPDNPRQTNAYNFVHLNFDTGKGLIYLRRWSETQGKWIPDHDSHDGGKFTFQLPKELGTPRPPTTTYLPDIGQETHALQLYRERLLALTAELELIGLGHGVQIKLPIEQAYVPLNVAAIRDLQRDPAGRYDEKHMKEHDHCDRNVRLAEIFKWAARFKSRGVVLLGDPGAGKTTGARQFCWRVLTEKDLPKALGLPAGAIPVLLRLRNVTSAHLAAGLKAFITEGVAGTLLSDDHAQPGPDLLARRGVLWIFDGLDEVVSEDARVRVCEWIREALASRPGDYFLVTSRYQGYQGPVDLGADFCEFHVKPLEVDQSAQFVECWYRAVYGRLHADDPESLVRAAAEARALLDLLQQPEYRVGRLRELPANPLLLTILCLVHHQDHNLPRRRADLYARCVRVLMEHWRKELWKAQGISGFDPEAAEGVLASVAWWLHEQEGRITHSVTELGAVASKALADLAPGAALGRDGEAFIRRMRDESGVLAMWSAGQCGFLHLTFQEYLSGLHAAREGKVDELAGQAGKSWWREVILVAAALGSREFAQRFFSGLVGSGAVDRDPALVDQCLEETRYAVLEPFVAGIRQCDGDEVRQLGLLQRLVPFARRGADELVQLCRELVAAREEEELAFLARELLQRCGEAVPTGRVELAGDGLEQRLDPRTEMVFVRVPAGEFLMGSGTGDSDERPVHKVRITRPFLLGKYLVTNQDYERFLTANPETQPPQQWRNSQFNTPRQPVVGVSWKDAAAFCRWASCRLPTEAEWEYACRAGNPGSYCFGDEESLLAEYAWFSSNSEGRTRDVGQKKPNAWGLYDVHGNVWEWCQEWHGSYPKKPVDDPTGPEEGDFRVLRGGSWVTDPSYLRSASRNHSTPDRRVINIGCRCVWVEDSSP